MLDAMEVEADGSEEVDVGAEAIEVTLEPLPQKDYGRNGARASTDRAPSAAQPAPAASSMAKKLDSIFDRVLETDYLEDAATIDKRTDTDEQPSLSRGMSEEELIELARAHRPAFTAPPGARMGNTKSASAKAGSSIKKKETKAVAKSAKKVAKKPSMEAGKKRFNLLRYKNTGKIGIRESGGRQLLQVGRKEWSQEQLEAAAAELRALLEGGASVQQALARRDELQASN